jgi:hypothetical protein
MQWLIRLWHELTRPAWWIEQTRTDAQVISLAHRFRVRNPFIRSVMDQRDRRGWISLRQSRALVRAVRRELANEHGA